MEADMFIGLNGQVKGYVIGYPVFLPLTMQVKFCLMKFALNLALQLTVY